MQFELTQQQQRIVDKLYDLHKDDNVYVSSTDTRSYTNGLSTQECKLLEKTFSEQLAGETIDRAMILIEFEPWGAHVDENARSGILIPIETQDTHTVIFGSGPRVTQEFYEQYISHIPRNRTESLFVEEIYAWQRGTGVKWDALQLHTSDNFPARGLDKKQALVIFTCR